LGELSAEIQVPHHSLRNPVLDKVLPLDNVVLAHAQPDNQTSGPSISGPFLPTQPFTHSFLPAFFRLPCLKPADLQLHTPGPAHPSYCPPPGRMADLGNEAEAFVRNMQQHKFFTVINLFMSYGIVRQNTPSLYVNTKNAFLRTESTKQSFHRHSKGGNTLCGAGAVVLHRLCNVHSTPSFNP
jgi:hypothetical protein